MVLAPGVAMNMYIHTSYEAILEHAKSISMRSKLACASRSQEAGF